MLASGPGSCASPPPEGFCAWKITSMNKKHSFQVPGERMIGFLTPRWWSSPKTQSHRDPAVFRRSLRMSMESALSAIFIWVALISPHSPVCGDAMSLHHVLQERVPSCQTAEGRQQERGQVCLWHSWPRSLAQIKHQTTLDLQPLSKETSESPGQTARHKSCNIQLLSVSLILLCSEILSGFKCKILSF